MIFFSLLTFRLHNCGGGGGRHNIFVDQYDTLRRHWNSLPFRFASSECVFCTREMRRWLLRFPFPGFRAICISLPDWSIHICRCVRNFCSGCLLSFYFLNSCLVSTELKTGLQLAVLDFVSSSHPLIKVEPATTPRFWHFVKQHFTTDIQLDCPVFLESNKCCNLLVCNGAENNDVQFQLVSGQREPNTCSADPNLTGATTTTTIRKNAEKRAQ